MNPKARTLSLAAAALAISIGCAEDDERRWMDGLNVYSGFGITATSPGYREVSVPVHSDIRLQFNEAVRRETVAGNVRVMITTASAAQDITNQFAISFADGDRLIVMTPAQPLTLDTDYLVRVSTTVTSVSNRPLFSPYELPFTTSHQWGYGDGYRTIAGQRPYVVFQNMLSGSQMCQLAVHVRFSEDLIRAPQARYRVNFKPLNQNLAQGIFNAQPVYANSMQDFYLFFMPGHCSQDWYGWGVDIFSYIDSATDRNGEDLDCGTGAGCTKKFDSAILGYGGDF